MTARTNRFARIAAAAATALLTFAVAMPALADSTTGTAEVTGGALTLDSAASFALSGTTLNGSDQTASATFDIDLKDLTGTGNGWRVTIEATPFTNAAESDILDADAAYINAMAYGCDDPDGAGPLTQTCTAPTSSVDYLSAPLFLNAPGTLFNAAADTGMGDFTLTPTFKLDLPANAYDGSYESTLTLTVASGPSA